MRFRCTLLGSLAAWLTVGCFGPSMKMRRLPADPAATTVTFVGRPTSHLGWTGVLLVFYRDANQLDAIRQFAGELRGTFEETITHSPTARAIYSRQAGHMVFLHQNVDFDGELVFTVSRTTHGRFRLYAVLGYSGTILARGELWE